MQTYRFYRHVIVAFMASALFTSAVLAQSQASSGASQMFSYKDVATGEQYFALSVSPTSATAPTQGRNIVIIADTSASIAADYRKQELETIQKFVGTLNPNTDTVCLVAGDVDASDLTSGFVAPNSPEFSEALSALQSRVPLGAMDIKSVLNSASAMPFKAGNNSIMFIGSGTSRANTLTPAQFGDMCQELVNKKLPVNSVAIGPNVDQRVLNCLAARTGGMVINPQDAATGDPLAAMDSATSATVIWPEAASVKWSAEFKPAMPLPPLRSDRDSMVVGTYTGTGALTLTAKTSNGQESWQATPVETAEQFNYLKGLVDLAKGASGSIPLVSQADLIKAESAMQSRVNELVSLSATAIANGSLEDAQNLVNELKATDANNPEISALETSLANAQKGAQSEQAGMIGAQEPTEFDLMDSAGLLNTQDASLGAYTQQKVGEVTRTINNARSTLRIDPEQSIQDLKAMREAIRRDSDIKEADRDILVRNLEAAIRESQQYGDQVAQRNAEAARRLAEAQDRKILAEQMMNQQEKMNQMGKRFESACMEKKYEQAQDIMVDMSNEMSDLDSKQPTAIAGIQWSRAVDNYIKQVQLRTLKQRRVCDTLFQCDKSAMPFPDEPPITYPDSAVWARLTASRREKYNTMDLAQSGDKEKSIQSALKEPTSMDFNEMPLSDIINELKAQHHIEIQVDNQALQEAMADVETILATPITKNLQGISLRAAMKLLLGEVRDVELSYVIEDEVLKITTKEKASSKLTTKVYPVADLVIPIRMPDMSNVFTSMGSNTSSMSNSGSSTSGSNNFGNGGQFNIPAENVRRNAAQKAIENQNFKAFSMKDDLSQPVAYTTEDTTDGKIIVVPESSDAKSFWMNYFNGSQIDDTLVHNTVLYYKHTNKYTEIINVLQSAMLAGKAQPWMYEALALAQLCAGRPQAEYERTLMSAVEFCDDAQTMVLIGVYMQRIGLHKRALQVFHEVAKNNPEMTEPFERALPIASIVNDREAKKWSSLGILSLAWPEEKQYLYDKANDVANSVVADLKSEGKTAEAKEFKAQIAQAKKRDCIIRVSWTGMADIDIAVEEPGGTICSMKNIQTPAGGFFMGDAHAGQFGQAGKTMSETYVCPQGFNGDYRLLVKKSWGNVVGNKVKVELFTHVSADDLNSIKGKKPMIGYIQLKDEQAGMMFTLHDGRRQAAAEQVIANAVNNQVNRAVLAQQLAQAFDPQAMQKLDTVAANGANDSSSLPFVPVYRQGAVGYSPQIITLPTGTNLMAQAVVSADRRYVRITSVPMFSHIPSVSIFNYVSGEESEGSVPNVSGD